MNKNAEMMAQSKMLEANSAKQLVPTMQSQSAMAPPQRPQVLEQMMQAQRQQPLMPFNHNVPTDWQRSRQPLPKPSPIMHSQENPLRKSGQSEEDRIQVRIRGKNNVVSTTTGSVSQTLSQQDDVRKQKKELSHATQRLKVLEQLEQYREEKVRKEMMMLEMQRMQEQQEMEKLLQADRKKQLYLEKQREKVREYQLKKAKEDEIKRRQAEKAKEKEALAKKKFDKDQQMKKQKIAEYKRQKLEAEEMLANADLPDYEDEPGYPYRVP